jgi:hypothetical protein
MRCRKKKKKLTSWIFAIPDIFNLRDALIKLLQDYEHFTVVHVGHQFVPNYKLCDLCLHYDGYSDLYCS